jgi:ComF family protein
LGIFSAIWEIAREQDCRLCGGRAVAPLCPGCDADMPRLPAARCPQCALPTPGGQRCGRCIADAPAYDTTAAALAYDFPVPQLIHQFKYRGGVGLAATFAGWLFDALPADGADRIDLIVPMPLSRRRLAERGYNQALEIARVLGRRRQVMVNAVAAVRTRHTPAQADLPWNERRGNIRGAFDATRRFDGMAVAVVDDVMTTGATLDELAAVLKAAGALRVENWVIARTLPPDRTHDEARGGMP